MKNIFYFLIIALLLFACNSDDLKEFEEDKIQRIIHSATDSISLLFEDTEIIHIGDSGLPYYSYYAVKKNSTKQKEEFLYAYNPSFHKLDVFDLQQGSYLKSIPLFEEGPYQVSDFDGFYFMGSNYLVFSSYSANQLLFYDINNEKPIQKVNFNDVKFNSFNGEQINLHSEPQFGMGIHYKSSDSLLIIPLYPWVNEKKSGFYNYPNLSIYDLKINQVKNAFSHFPEIYRKGTFFPLVNKPSICLVDQKLVVTYGVSNEIFIYTLDGKISQIYSNNPKSIETDHQQGIRPRSANIQEQSNFLVTNPFYLKTLYDPIYQVYYRFLKLPQDLKRTDGKLNRRYYGNWKVELLNKEFRKIGEKIFDGSQYNMLFSFIGRKGLYIGTYSHPNENELKLDIFKIADKNE